MDNGGKMKSTKKDTSRIDCAEKKKNPNAFKRRENGSEAIMGKAPKMTAEEKKALSLEMLRAIRTGDSETVAIILDSGFDVDAPIPTYDGAMSGDTSTPLVVAVGSQDVQIVRLLLEEYHADPNKPSSIYESPLLKAAIFKSSEIVEMLLSNGADPNGLNPFWETPLHKAVEAGNLDNAELLLTHNAHPAIESKKGSTPFDLAAMEGNAEMVQLLKQFW